MAVSGKHRASDSPLSHELTCKTPFPSLKLFFLIGILSLSALSIALLIYLIFRLSRTSKKHKTLTKEMNSGASSGPCYEVFLSFRGLDTRHGFTDYLYHSMVDAGILVFRDDESLRIGKRISDELQQAIENSKIYIPIFSTNYATSHWCLEELAYMVDCTSKSNGNKEILPIFLDVEPDDVKLKKKLYSKALSKHQRKFSTEAVESWKKALMEVDEIKGWNLKKDEGQGSLIRSIIRSVSVKLKVAYENVTEHLVGVDDHVEAIIKMLNVESDGVRFLGLHRMGGVGKTTLAKVVFNRLSSSFDRCCFLADVRESSKGNNGMVNLQKQLLLKLIGSNSTNQIYHMNDGINLMNKGVLKKEKVLIVLDDVDEKEQLKSLVGKGNWFGSSSRIIITTRNQSVLMIDGDAASQGPGKKSTNILTYDLQEMKFGHALELFSWHAFRRDFPPDHRVSLSKNIVHTLGKLPLALEITGSALSGKSEALWIDTLEKLQEAPPIEVQKKLMITYERLDHAQRQVFLDIACFFVKQDKTYPFHMWEARGYHPYDALEVLILLSLIKVEENNTFWMHDQVQDLGKEIVRKENFKDLCKRSRVWNSEEAKSILKHKEGTRKIEALSLRYFRHAFDNDDDNKSIILKHDEFANLWKLRFFKGDTMTFIGDFKNLLPNLRWLSWQKCPPNFEATNFHLTNLVVLDLSQGNIDEEWNGWNQIRVARQLKVLDLSHCPFVQTPDLSMWVSLERLILEGCRNLIEIDPSIGKLKLLTSLNLKNCQSLKKLPEEIGGLQALAEIVMPPMLCELPETFGNFQSLLKLELSGRPIKKLPHLIGGLVNIRQLNLSKCGYIDELLDSIGKVRSLVQLDLSWTSIRHLPNSIGNLNQLKVLRMSWMSKMTKLSRAIGRMEKLEELDASGCQNLTGDIPKEIGGLSCLKILCLPRTHISGLPTMVSCLNWLETSQEYDTSPTPWATQQLKVLDLSRCPLLRTPVFSICVSLERLILEGCHKLIEIDPSIGKLKLLTSLNLKNCWSLQKLPEEIGHLQALTEIVMPPMLCELPETFGNFQSLLKFEVSDRPIKKLPHLIGGLVNIRRLNLYKCEYIDELPNSIGKLRSLVELDLSWTSIHHLPNSTGNLKQLKVLRMSWMSEMTKLSRVIGLMEKLEELDVSGCQNLTGDIPEEIGGLSCLRILCLSHTHISGLPTTMSCLSNLQTLDLESCPELKRLPELPSSLTCLKWTHHGKWDSFVGLMKYETKILVHALPTSMGTLSQLEILELSGKHVRFLPQLPSSLRELRLIDLKTTQSPDFSNLKNLSVLEFYDCSMPEFSGIFDAQLKSLCMHNCKFEKLDALFQLEMERLRFLGMESCEFLPEVLDLSRMKNLKEVILFGCKPLVKICGLEELRLVSLTVVNCSSMKKIRA